MLVFFAFEFVHMALSATLFSIIAVFVSAYIPNPFISLAVPAVFYGNRAESENAVLAKPGSSDGRPL